MYELAGADEMVMLDPIHTAVGPLMPVTGVYACTITVLVVLQPLLVKVPVTLYTVVADGNTSVVLVNAPVLQT